MTITLLFDALLQREQKTTLMSDPLKSQTKNGYVKGILENTAIFQETKYLTYSPVMVPRTCPISGRYYSTEIFRALNLIA